MKKVITIISVIFQAAMLAGCSSTPVESAVEAQTNAASDPVPLSTSIDAVEIPAKVSYQTHDDEEDYSWDDATVIPITLDGATIQTDGNGVIVNGSSAVITAAGTYSLSGTLNDGQIKVDTQDKDIVRIILNGAHLSSASSSTLYIAKANNAMIYLADGSQNSITDASAYNFENSEEDEPDAAIFSKADLTIAGNGSLSVNGNFNDGIAGKDGLVIAGGNINVQAVDDGIRGKDYVVIKGGNITVSSQGDGIKSDNEEGSGEGFIAIENGTVRIVSGGDAITAQSDVTISGGDFTISAGRGSDAVIDETASAKGIKSAANVSIIDGSFLIDAADDALHSNGNIYISNGSFILSSADDGIHADQTVQINQGNIQVVKSYEGIEGALITIFNGVIRVVSSDDGINVATGVDGSGMMGHGGGQRPGGDAGGFPAGAGARPGGAPGMAPGAMQDSYTYTGSNYLNIHGGAIYVEAAGDGIDVNGAIEMTGGLVVVNGPTEQMNGALDFDGGFNISGGSLVAAGSSGMAQAPSANSGQNSLLVFLSSTQPAGTLFHIQNSRGEEILTFAPVKLYQSVVFSSSQLENGETYTIYLGGNASGISTDGIYQGGTYTPGTEFEKFTVSGAVTMVGSSGRHPGRP